LSNDTERRKKIQEGIDRWRPRIWVVVRRNMFVPPYTQEDQEDILQAVTIKLFVEIQQNLFFLEDEVYIKNWLNQVTTNLIKSEGRRAFRHSEILSDSIDTDLIEHKTLDDLGKISVDDAIKQLKPEEKAVVQLLLQGCTLDEISNTTGLSVDQVRYRITNSKNKIAVSLELTTTPKSKG
jgi:RNA polymerase sigma factor (sigma-70 family)